ncbi:hypothetical protein EsH8_VIII_000942 [Colletotrichum jinshuiense]
MEGDVAQRATSAADRLTSLLNESKSIPEQALPHLSQLRAELGRTPALYSLIHHDPVCQVDSTPLALLSLAPVNLSTSQSSFRHVDEALRVFELKMASATASQYTRLMSNAHKQIKAFHDDIRADIVLAIKYTLNLELFLHHAWAVQLRDAATARDPGLVHDIYQIRIQRGDAPLKAGLLLPNSAPDVDIPTPCLAFYDGGMVIETRPMPRDDPDMLQRVLKLATFLHATNSAYLLCCTGVRVNTPRQRLEYLYIASPVQGCHLGLYRLSDHLGSPDGHFTRGRREAAARRLSDKIRFAGALARTLSELHAVDRVHGNVCSNNVWFAVKGTGYEAKVSPPLLVGFDLDNEEPRRRPGDDGALEEAKRGDILALGVLLLEIGLGVSVADDRVSGSGGGGGGGGGGVVVAAAEHLRTLSGIMGGKYTAAVRAALAPQLLPAAFASMGGGEVGLDRAFRGVVVDELLGVVERV